MQNTGYCPMKKVLFSSLFLLLFTTIEGFSQTTYLYKCIKSVTSDGTMEKCNSTVYYTFSGDVMYQSDKNGYKTTNSLTYKYKETINGNSIYMRYTTPIRGYTMNFGGWETNAYYLVSPDKSTVNWVYNYNPISKTFVYVRTTEAQVAKEQEQKKKDQYQLIR